VDIFQNVEALRLPPDQYVVFGSGPLEAHGIRRTRDVDLFVTPPLYQELKTAGWEEQARNHMPGNCLSKDGLYEADYTWHYGDYNPTPEEIIAAADIIRGIPFAPIIEVLKWKRAYGRPKDLADIALIGQYLG
jgi:hypothetical protein